MNKNTFLFIGAVSLVFALVFCANGAKAENSVLAELLAKIELLQNQIKELQKQAQALDGWCHSFDKNIKIEERGTEVAALQIALKKEGFTIDGAEMANSYYGESTASAVSGFQEKYKSEVLTLNKLTRGTGYVGSATRNKLNKLYDCNKIAKNPGLKVISPNGFEKLVIGNTVEIIFCGENLKDSEPGGFSHIYLLKGGEKFGLIDENSTSGIAGCPTRDVWKWTVGELNEKTGDDYKIGVEFVNQAGEVYIEDISDNYFSIINSEEEEPYIKVTTPNGGEEWQEGKTYSITWTSNEIDTVDISLEFSNGGGIELARDIKAFLGRYDWKVNTMSVEKPHKIIISGSGVTDKSDERFFIVEAYSCVDTDNGKNLNVKGSLTSKFGTYTDSCFGNGKVKEYYCASNDDIYGVTDIFDCPMGCGNGACLDKSITLTSPNGGEKWEAGSTHDITWENNGVDYVMIELDRGSEGWHLEYKIDADLGKYSWKVPNMLGDGYKIKIWDTANPAVDDESDGTFNIE
jgi:hypothetical protein